MEIKYILLSLINSALSVFGQVLWKYGLVKAAGSSYRLLYNPLILSGILVYGISTVLWLFILSKLPFSIAYPLNSLAYALSIFAGFYLFKEPLSVQKIMGMLLIMGGVFFIARG